MMTSAILHFRPGATSASSSLSCARGSPSTTTPRLPSFVAQSLEATSLDASAFERANYLKTLALLDDEATRDSSPDWTEGRLNAGIRT